MSRGKHVDLLLPLMNLLLCSFLSEPSGKAEGGVHGSLHDALLWWQSNAPLLPFPSLSPVTLAPSSPSQAVILLASRRVKRGVRVGSICLCDGHWCQALRGLEQEESRLVWSGRVADVSELSCTTPNRAEAKAEAGTGEWTDQEGQELGGQSKRGWGWREKLQAFGCWIGLYADNLDLFFFSSHNGQLRHSGRLTLSGNSEETIAESVSLSSLCQGAQWKNLKQNKTEIKTFTSAAHSAFQLCLCGSFRHLTLARKSI